MKERLLLVEDDASFREVMKFHLADEGIAADAAEDGPAALRMFRKTPYPVVVTDLKMPRMDGLTLLQELKKLAPEILVIVITAFGDIDTAVRAMKEGAFDFVPKPFDRTHFIHAVRKAIDHHALRRQVEELRSQVDSAAKDLIFASAAMDRVLAVADRFAEADATVVVLGESGTGKELLARRIHRKSNRADGPFVAVNCAAIPRDLLESELFGHMKGAFTGAVKDRQGKFEQARGGTLFLDEIAEMPLDLQPRLLRALQERTIDVVGAEQPVTVDVRVVAATNRDLEALVAAGEFRTDLFFRINILPVSIPPLRERREDIPALVDHFLARYGKGQNLSVSPALLKQLESYDWPGNVRELENVCQRLALFADGDVLDGDLLPANLTAGPAGKDAPVVDAIPLPAGGASLSEMERSIIVRALELNDYNQSRTARFLKVQRHILLYRMRKHKIEPKRSGE